jgi:hypothetical protein
MWAERETDITKLIVALRNFANASKTLANYFASTGACLDINKENPRRSVLHRLREHIVSLPENK